jgi:hypothetical protein
VLNRLGMGIFREERLTLVSGHYARSVCFRL